MAQYLHSLSKYLRESQRRSGNTSSVDHNTTFIQCKQTMRLNTNNFQQTRSSLYQQLPKSRISYKKNQSIAIVTKRPQLCKDMGKSYDKRITEEEFNTVIAIASVYIAPTQPVTMDAPEQWKWKWLCQKPKIDTGIMPTGLSENTLGETNPKKDNISLGCPHIPTVAQHSPLPSGFQDSTGDG